MAARLGLSARALAIWHGATLRLGAAQHAVSSAAEISDNLSELDNRRKKKKPGVFLIWRASNRYTPHHQCSKQSASNIRVARHQNGDNLASNDKQASENKRALLQQHRGDKLRSMRVSHATFRARGIKHRQIWRHSGHRASSKDSGIRRTRCHILDDASARAVGLAHGTPASLATQATRSASGDQRILHVACCSAHLCGEAFVNSISWRGVFASA